MRSPVCPEGASLTGVYRISWTGMEGATFRVEERGPEGVVLLYEGTDLATLVGGRGRGGYEYRVSENEGPWSKPCAVEVAPPSWKRTVAFVGLGLAVVVAVAYLLVRARRARS